ncbi:hypothetical protein [Chromobacterium sp. CV08]|uniref:hypothetical protein n=1 Tax=Chromobacterium sp. CV08 TaxID=3133274 RepID=UPI003DA80422
MYRYSTLSLLAVVAFTCGAAAYAAGTRLTGEIAIAERHVNGWAGRAECGRAGLGRAYAVARGGRAFDVGVDPARGAVLESGESKADRDERD